MKKIAILTSGGDAPGMNACIRSVVRTASNIIYFSTKHSKSLIDKYLNSLEKVFKMIAECEDGRNIDQLLKTRNSQNFFQRLN